MTRKQAIWTLIAMLAMPLARANPLSDEDIEARLREPVPSSTDAASEKILEAHLRALGGLGRIMMVYNTVSEGTLREGREESEVTWYRAAPDRLRVESRKTRQGRTHEVIQGYNGEKAWVFDKSRRHPFPEEMPAKEAIGFIQQADFYGPIVNREKLGLVFRYEGEVRSRGRKQHLLKMYYPTGRAVYLYLDAETMMVTRSGYRDNLHGTIVDYDTFYTRYHRVEGVWFPVEMEMALANQVYGTLKFESIEVNQPLEPGLFDEPKVREVWLRQRR